MKDKMKRLGKSPVVEKTGTLSDTMFDKIVSEIREILDDPSPLN